MVGECILQSSKGKRDDAREREPPKEGERPEGLCSWCTMLGSERLSALGTLFCVSSDTHVVVLIDTGAKRQMGWLSELQLTGFSLDCRCVNTQ